jgi:hypothetical protein
MRSPAVAALAALCASLVACSSSTSQDASSADSNLDQSSSPWKLVKSVGNRPGTDEVDQEKSAIAVDGTGRVHVVFTSRDGLSISVVDGDGTSKDETIDTGGNTGRFVAIALGADGREHIAYFQNAVPIALKYAERKDDGSWTIESISGAAENPSMAVDANGTTHVTWLDYAKNEIDYASRPAGGAWSAVEKVDASQDGDAALAVTRSGEVHVVYSKALQAGANDARRGSDGTWSSQPIALGDKLGPVVVTADAAGALHVAAARLDGSRTLAYATRPAGGDWTAAEVADTNQAVGAYHVAIAVDDSAQLVRIVASGNDQPILREATHANGAWTGIWIGQEGQLPSLAIDGGGNAHLTYRAGGSFVYARRAR